MCASVISYTVIKGNDEDMLRTLVCERDYGSSAENPYRKYCAVPLPSFAEVTIRSVDLVTVA